MYSTMTLVLTILYCILEADLKFSHHQKNKGNYVRWWLYPPAWLRWLIHNVHAYQDITLYTLNTYIFFPCQLCLNKAERKQQQQQQQLPWLPNLWEKLKIPQWVTEGPSHSASFARTIFRHFLPCTKVKPLQSVHPPRTGQHFFSPFSLCRCSSFYLEWPSLLLWWQPPSRARSNVTSSEKTCAFHNPRSVLTTPRLHELVPVVFSSPAALNNNGRVRWRVAFAPELCVASNLHY